jgi:hypothetical protein
MIPYLLFVRIDYYSFFVNHPLSGQGKQLEEGVLVDDKRLSL